MAVKMVCDFCDKPLELEDGKYVIYHTKQLNTRKIFKHLCKNCADNHSGACPKCEGNLLYYC